jgi:hypothetical protein
MRSPYRVCVPRASCLRSAFSCLDSAFSCLRSTPPPQTRMGIGFQSSSPPSTSFYLLFTGKCLWTTRHNSRSPHFGSVVVIDLLKKFN